MTTMMNRRKLLVSMLATGLTATPALSQALKGGGGALAANANEWRTSHGTVTFGPDSVHHSAPSEGETSYFVAPASMHGNWLSMSHISFDKLSSGGRYYQPYAFGGEGDIVLENGLMRLSYSLPEHHDGQWHSYRISLAGPGWSAWSGATSMQDVLRNVTGVRIRAEYGEGADQAALRRVVVA
jgi:hypothetical protein